MQIPQRVLDWTWRRARTVTIFHYILLAEIAAYFFVFSWYGIEKYEFFRTGYSDFGTQVQNVWLMAHGLPTAFSLSRPIFLLVSGIFLVIPRPEVLLVIEAATLAAGAIPVYLIATLDLQDSKYGLLFSTLYLIYPALWGVNQYEFHDMSFVVPSALFMFYFWKSNNFKGYSIALMLLLISNQFAVVIASAFLVYMLIKGHSVTNTPSPRFMLITLASIILFIAYLQLIPLFPFHSLYTVSPGSYTFIGSTTFVNPLPVLQSPFQSLLTSWPDKLAFLVFLFGPLLLLPLVGYLEMIPAIPWLLVVLTYTPSVSVNGIGPFYHLYSPWPSFVIPFIFVAAISGLKRVCRGLNKGSLKRAFVLMFIVTIAISGYRGAFSPISTPTYLSVGDYTVPTDFSSTTLHGVWPTPVEYASILDGFIPLIPPSYSVLTQNQLGSKLAERDAFVENFYQPHYSNVNADAILIAPYLESQQVPPSYCGSCFAQVVSHHRYGLYASCPVQEIYLYIKDYRGAQIPVNCGTDTGQVILPTTSLAGYWPLNEGKGTVALDLGGTGDNGTLMNSPTWLPEGSCIISSCLSFNASKSQFVQVPNTEKLTFGSSIPFTISASIYLNDLASEHDIVSKGTGQAGASDEYDLVTASGGLSFYVDGSWYYSDGGLVTKAWQQVDVVFTGSQACFYFGGTLDKCDRVSGTYASNTTNSFFIGIQGSGCLCHGMNGSIRDVRIYNVPLTPMQVSVLYFTDSFVTP